MQLTHETARQMTKITRERLAMSVLRHALGFESGEIAPMFGKTPKDVDRIVEDRIHLDLEYLATTPLLAALPYLAAQS